MKVSIFESVNPLPKSKEEKHQQSKKASQCAVKSVQTDSDLVDLVTRFAWSPFVFRNNKRLAENFISTDLLVYDIDEGMTLEQAEEIITKNKLCCLCLPSTSHTPEAHRFRIILPLGQTITNAEVYAETWRKGAELFGVVDEQCKDLGRFFFSCRSDDGFWIEGDLITPVQPKLVPVDYKSHSQVTVLVTEDIDKLVTEIYGEKRTKIPEAVDYFIRNANTGLPGNWVNSLNSCVFSLALSGVEEDVIMSVTEQLAPNPLDRNDLYQIKRAIKDGKNAV